MSEEMHATLRELEAIEADDSLHDFGGPHGSKGGDFATYWIVLRLTELEKAGNRDYLFVSEYMQDVAEFDSSTEPKSLRLYQLKKREDGYWTFPTLTGQTNKRFEPKADSPVYKLLRHVHAVSNADVVGAFVTNAKFDVLLASGQRSVNDVSIRLHALSPKHAEGLRVAMAEAFGVEAQGFDLSKVELQSAALAIDDLQRHSNGVMLEFLSIVAPEHVAQAASLVDTLYVSLKAIARRTEKCATWEELVKKRGFGREKFQAAVSALKTIPDKPSARRRLFDKLSSAWRNFEVLKAEAALNRCALDKVLIGESNRWNAEQLLRPTFALAQDEQWSDQQRFDAACFLLTETRPELSVDEIRAISIFEMTEWDLSQIPA